MIPHGSMRDTGSKGQKDGGGLGQKNRKGGEQGGLPEVSSPRDGLPPQLLEPRSELRPETLGSMESLSAVLGHWALWFAHDNRCLLG